MKKQISLLILCGICICFVSSSMFAFSNVATLQKSFTPQEEIPTLRGSLGATNYYITNHMTNTSWDFALSDVTQDQVDGTTNQLLDSGADDYGYAQDGDFNRIMLVNTWIEISITEWVGGNSFAGSIQLHFTGASWVYNIIDFTGTGVYRANLSLYSGDELNWIMYNLHDGTQGVSYYNVDYCNFYQNQTIGSWVHDQTINITLDTPEEPIWNYDQGLSFHAGIPEFVGSLNAFVSMLGLVMILSLIHI